MGRIWMICASVLATTLTYSALAAAEERDRDPSIANGVEPVAVDTPVFPEPYFHDQVRLWAGSTAAPSADFGGVDLDLIRPELRLRARVPIGGVVSFQLTADFRTSLYDTHGDGALFEDCADCSVPHTLYSTSVGVQSGYLLNRNGWSIFRPEERWAVLGALFVSARWEPGAFEQSITPGVSIGLGYQIPDKLRVALAARIERALDGDGVEVGPSGEFQWDFAPNFRLRNREIGLQLEYRPAARWEFFLTGLRAGDRFRLDRTSSGPSGTTFHDRQVMVGGGLVFKVYHALRLTAEAGAIVDRQVYVESRDDGRLDTVDGDPSPYFSFRVEFRP